MSEQQNMALRVNAETYTVAPETQHTLLHVLRDTLFLTAPSVVATRASVGRAPCCATAFRFILA